MKARPKGSQKKLNSNQSQQILETLERRFNENMSRHVGIAWKDVAQRLKAQPVTLWSLSEMERTGGEPDVIGHDSLSDELIFCDCSHESPAGRRSICYDQAGLDSRKEHKPVGSAVELAAAMGIELITEEQYRHLQTLGQFDTKTSSWISTPDRIRKLGGALFCDRRYDTVFTYHNGAQSYYAVRGFRGCLRA